MTKENSSALIDEVLKHFPECNCSSGATMGQIIHLTKSINKVQGHLTEFRKDKHSLRGLIATIERRKKSVQYLKRQSQEQYSFIVDKLKIRI